MSKKIIGIDLGGTSAKLAILTPEGDIQKKWSVETNILNGGVAIVPNIIESIQEQLNLLNLTPEDFYGIGMGSPGKVDAKEKTVIGAYNLNWSELQLVGQQFETAFGIPFYIDNDANVAALGEQWKGAGNGEPDVVMFTLGTGVGGGVVINHQLVRGAGGTAGEVGHIFVDEKHRFDCTCGNAGCLETVASATGIVKLARQYSNEFAGSSEIKERIDSGEAVTARDIFDAAKDEDTFSEHVVEEFARYLGIATSHIANILNPQIIVLGGGVSAAGKYLLEKVEKYHKEFSFPQVRDVTKLELAQIGNDAGVIGAARLVPTK
ncbi:MULTISPECIES: ROK family glucokinase [unclassified Facklamia]|uniref:ROK family glucokinase n=1 Tax=Aerococcaceae TaxID=186827 RepID=UPI0013BC5E4B|nr:MULTISPECIES: ROK family glucokinase [unclassified Facklamia]NEW63570.1 ROK family glucokinase [Facklamia sp. 252]NEW67041.1 ROK family glucokinase [Facklamia sp. 253]QQD66411.1 ROK family glucokinase [Aerococcaceae bacterium zg-252]